MPSTRSAHLLCAVALAGLLAACGSPTPADPAPAPAGGGHGGGGHGGGGHGAHGSSATGLYAVQSGPLGVVATDDDGHLLYRSDDDTPAASSCTGGCTDTWIPLLSDTPPELLGVDEELVGTFDRPDGGAQVTLAGWPLYRHVDDDGGLLDAGRHGADDTWFVITPGGEKATG